MLAYNKEGSGERALLLITGLGGHASFWDKQRPGLAEQFTVLSFDQRGMGANREVTGRHTLDEIVSDAISILDDAGVAKASIIGHSMGGVITQCIVLDHPSRVRSAVFSGTFCAFDWYMMTIGNLRQKVLETAGSAAFGHLSALLAMPGANVLDPSYDLKARLDGGPKATDQVMQLRQKAVYSFDRRDELRQVDLPSLVVGATDDMLAPPYQSRNIAELIPGARLEMLDGGHFFPVTRPERYFEVIQPFLAEQVQL
ncbi:MULTISPECIES: alpha/beta fold hydrolase [Rhizobium]|nr:MULTISPECIES: alpha/beta hydrolase [Rhizobium]MBY3171499.1 alpha/beta fold hydrolase [Rhizobium laguerreae]MBY3300016.1 alpha/beta fold hydrolase [Rhizobium laguerreae]MBY5419964.1 alpha/beta fold hydrolase [Rhizobium leguminosarum]MBY5427111.1 alpha/beta fold hydrolase [Rhizobium leguminosarum]MBY5793984.1 alpha/beta fold hydrolase [Rhizobium leguminosarum]